jgi:hypothetical protein
LVDRSQPVSDEYPQLDPMAELSWVTAPRAEAPAQRRSASRQGSKSPNRGPKAIAKVKAGPQPEVKPPEGGKGQAKGKGKRGRRKKSFKKGKGKGAGQTQGATRFGGKAARKGGGQSAGAKPNGG